jgi:thioredoxin-dependent peroxiredoxin
MIVQGDRAPALELRTSDGETIDLSSPGRLVVLYFYPKDDTSGCTREAQDFTELADEFKAAGVKVVGVSRDSMGKHEKFIAKYELAVPLASDEDGRVSDAFGTWVQKSMYGRKYMGMERSTFLIGPDGRVLREWRKVKVPGHAREVLDWARELELSR